MPSLRLQAPSRLLPALLIALAAPPAAAQSGYVFQLLDPASGAIAPTTSTAEGRSASAGTVGSCRTATGSVEPCLWQGGAPQPMGLPAGSLSGAALAVNAEGVVVGNGYGASGPRAFRWDGALTELEGLVPGGPASAEDVNVHGVAVGSSVSAPGGSLDRAVVWSPDGTVASLGTLGGPRSLARAINAAGVIVGHSQVVAFGPDKAFVHVRGTMRPLPELDPAAKSQALGISDAGVAVGFSALAGTRTPVAWSGDGVRALAMPPAVDSAWARAVNASGQIVGNAKVNSFERPFLWQRGGAVFLKDLVATTAWSFEEATDIDADGRIVGWGLKLGNARAFELTPVPANLDRDADVDSEDFALFRRAYLAGSSTADLDGDGRVTRRDVRAFLAALRTL